MTTVRTVASSTRRLTLGVLAATGLAAALMAPAAHAQNALDNILKAKKSRSPSPPTTRPTALSVPISSPRAWMWKWPTTSQPSWV